MIVCKARDCQNCRRVRYHEDANKPQLCTSMEEENVKRCTSSEWGQQSCDVQLSSHGNTLHLQPETQL